MAIAAKDQGEPGDPGPADYRLHGAIRLAKELEGHLTAKGVGLVLKPFDIDDLPVEVGKFLSRFSKGEHANGMPIRGT